MMHKKTMLTTLTTIGYAGLGVLLVNASDTRFRLLVMAGYVGFTVLFYCTLQMMYQAEDAEKRLAELQARHGNEKAQLNRQKTAWKHATTNPVDEMEYQINRTRWLLAELELKTNKSGDDTDNSNGKHN